MVTYHVWSRSFRQWCLGVMALVIFTLPAHTQELDTSPLTHQQDFLLWSSAKISKELVKDLELSLEAGHRRENNLLTTSAWLMDVGVGYEFSKHLEVNIAYRYRTDLDENSSRFNADVRLSKEIDRFTVSLRTRAQRTLETDANHDNFLRERLQISYNIKKNPLEPFVSIEGFYHFSYLGNQWEGIRCDIGTDWKVRKRTKVGMYYRFDREFNVVEPEQSHILGLEFKYKLK